MEAAGWGSRAGPGCTRRAPATRPAVRRLAGLALSLWLRVQETVLALQLGPHPPHAPAMRALRPEELDLTRFPAGPSRPRAPRLPVSGSHEATAVRLPEDASRGTRPPISGTWIPKGGIREPTNVSFCILTDARRSLF